jgi:hypothetical protein
MSSRRSRMTMAGRKAIVSAQVARGEYVVDHAAVAEAIVRRRFARRRSSVLEAGDPVDDSAVRSDEAGDRRPPDLA